ncbi:SET domain-containing protein, partial [Calocera cornea HHB12733]
MKRGFLKKGLGLEDSSTSSAQTKVNPPSPTVLPPLGRDDGYVSDDLRRATARAVKRTHTDPSMERAMSHGYAVLGFGITNTANLHDTLCITYGDNRSHLMAHPGFNRYMHPLLLEANRSVVEIVKITGKGLGMVAKQDIPRATIFLRERPLLTLVGTIDLQLASRLPQLLEHMDPPKRAAFRALHNSKLKGDDATNLTGILRTNGFEVEWPFDKGEPQRAVFDWICRANHSCSPNTGFEWDHASFCGIFRSLRDIKQGEEVSVTYIYLLQSADTRRLELQEKHKFTCRCSAC